jgi:hypothetical protein
MYSFWPSTFWEALLSQHMLHAIGGRTTRSKRQQKPAKLISSKYCDIMSRHRVVERVVTVRVRQVLRSPQRYHHQSTTGISSFNGLRRSRSSSRRSKSSIVTRRAEPRRRVALTGRPAQTGAWGRRRKSLEGTQNQKGAAGGKERYWNNSSTKSLPGSVQRTRFQKWSKVTKQHYHENTLVWMADAQPTLVYPR